MDQPQNATPSKSEIEVVNSPIPYSQLSYIQRAYVDWKALNGLITDDDGIRKMTLTELAVALKVDRTTVYRAAEKIPNLWDLVNDRIKELFPQSRLQKVRETWYLKAAKGDFQHMQLFLANFDKDFRMPAQKVEHELGNSWAALLENKRKVIDSEPTNADPNP